MILLVLCNHLLAAVSSPAHLAFFVLYHWPLLSDVLSGVLSEHLLTAQTYLRKFLTSHVNEWLNCGIFPDLVVRLRMAHRPVTAAYGHCNGKAEMITSPSGSNAICYHALPRTLA